MSGLVLADNEYKKIGTLYSSNQLSPNLKKFIDGLNDGSGVSKATLEKYGLLMNDGTAWRVMGSNRTYEEQFQVYKRGRIVNFEKKENSRGYQYVKKSAQVVATISTNAWPGTSYHNFGCAVDICLRKIGDQYGRFAQVQTPSGATFTNVMAFYNAIGLLGWADKCGLRWGGDWDSDGFNDDSNELWDMVHFEHHVKLPSDVWSYNCNWLSVAPSSGVVEEVLSSSATSAPSGGSGGGVKWAVLGGLVAVLLFLVVRKR